MHGFLWKVLYLEHLLMSVKNTATEGKELVNFTFYFDELSKTPLHFLQKKALLI